MDQIDEGVEIGRADHLADIGVAVTAAAQGAKTAPTTETAPAAAKAYVAFLGGALGYIKLLGRACVDQGQQGVGFGSFHIEPAGQGAKAARYEPPDQTADIVAARIAIGVGDVRNDEVVGGRHLTTSDVRTALQVARRIQSGLEVAHGQAAVAIDDAQAARLEGEQLDQSLGIGQAEAFPPPIFRLLDRGPAERSVATGQVGRQGVLRPVPVHAVLGEGGRDEARGRYADAQKSGENSTHG